MKTSHRIILGDSLKILKTIPERTIDLVFADPPYNLSKRQGLGWEHSSHVTMQEEWDTFSKEDFFDFNKKWISECERILKPGGSFWISGSFHNIYQVGHILQQHTNLRINNSIVWFKPNAQPNITCRFFTESTEHLIWATKNPVQWKFNYFWTKNHIHDQLNPQGKQTRNVWNIPLTPRQEKWAGIHPNQKPFELLRRIILSCTDEGDLVLDPFLGSGTTSIVSRYYGRNSIGIEINPKYMGIIKTRLTKSHKTFNNEEAKVIFEEF